MKYEKKSRFQFNGIFLEFCKFVISSSKIKIDAKRSVLLLGFFLSSFWVFGFFPVYTVHSAIVGVGKYSGFLLYSAKFVHSLDVISRAFYLGIWYSHSWWHIHAIHHGACTHCRKKHLIS